MVGSCSRLSRVVWMLSFPKMLSSTSWGTWRFHRPDEIYNPSSESRVYPRVSSQLDGPRRHSNQMAPATWKLAVSNSKRSACVPAPSSWLYSSLYHHLYGSSTYHTQRNKLATCSWNLIQPLLLEHDCDWIKIFKPNVLVSSARQVQGLRATFSIPAHNGRKGYMWHANNAGMHCIFSFRAPLLPFAKYKNST